jgi:hypothetical protein
MFKQVVAIDQPLISHQAAVPPTMWNIMSLQLAHAKTSSNALAAFVSSKSRAVEAASELPHTIVAKHRLRQVTEQLGSVSSCLIQFFSCHDRPNSGD